jgi:NAD(P)-dependent dehydrogenase (short-subunit alcohol dehydrogenase family)
MPSTTILITGATDGIGKAAALKLAEEGHHLLLHGRNAEKGEALKQEIVRKTGNDKLEFYLADFTSLQQIADMARKVRKDQDRLDVLINNAGMVSREYRETKDEIEATFQVNYLAQFLLTWHLLPLLRQSAPSRIVNVSSVGQSTVQFDREAYRRQYGMMEAYNQSKLAVILFTFELAGRLENAGVTVNAVHPGTLLDTNLVDKANLHVLGKPESGGEVLRYLATSKDLEGVSGKYFNEKREGKARPQAYDAQARELLWKMSEEMCADFLPETAGSI